MSDNQPRPYELDKPEERTRLLRELAGYCKVSAFHEQGGDRLGREFASEALYRALKLGCSLTEPKNPEAAPVLTQST